MTNIQGKNNIRKTGFTLIEMMVAVFVFSVVMVVAVGAIFSVVSANKTSQALKSVLDNLNSTLDNMAREIRYGTKYNLTDYDPAHDAANAANQCVATNGGCTDFTFQPKCAVGATCHTLNYKLVNNSIVEIYDGDPGTQRSLTAPEVYIKDMHFYTLGTGAGTAQPRVLMTISGYPMSAPNTVFNLETFIAQRSMVCTKYHNVDSSIICN